MYINDLTPVYIYHDGGLIIKKSGNSYTVTVSSIAYSVIHAVFVPLEARPVDNVPIIANIRNNNIDTCLSGYLSGAGSMSFFRPDGGQPASTDLITCNFSYVR